MKKISSILLFLFCSLVAWTQEYPSVPDPFRFINDYTGVLNRDTVALLETRLADLDDSTYVQVAVVVVPTLNDLEPNVYAEKLFTKWGIGHKENDAGVLVLIKPKTEDAGGKVFIMTGYGAEGMLPDALLRLMIEYEMIPKFKEENYTQAVVNVINAIEPIARGEYSAEDYIKQVQSTEGIGVWIFLLAFIALIVISIKKSKKGGNNGSGTYTSSGPFRGVGPIIRSGGFGGGSGSIGRSFGGGRTGGGGAGGSW